MTYIGTVLAIVMMSLTILFAYYGFMNTDPKDCFYFPGLNEPSRDAYMLKKAAVDADLKDEKGYPLNMARVFKIWFQWGFFTVFASLWLSILLFYPIFRGRMGKIFDSKGVCFDMFLVIVGAVSALNGIFWLILGGVWRFSKAGKVASGAYLEKTQEQQTNDTLW